MGTTKAKATTKTTRTKTAKKTTTKRSVTPKSASKNVQKTSKAKTVWMGIFLVALPVIVGVVASALTMDVMNSFGALNQPPFAPPAWLFPVAWTALYILMGLASFLIWRKRTPGEDRLRWAELIIYFLQLFVNFWWTLIFFKFEMRFFAFGWLIAMWIMILVLVIMTFRNNKPAAWCLLPYLLWTTFAGVLNISIAIMNQ